MTEAVKSELAALPITKSCCRKAETATLLRFGGGLAGPRDVGNLAGIVDA